MSSIEARPPLRVALVQFKPTKGDVPGNIRAVRDLVASQVDHADLVVFPEAALSGYFLEGGVAEAALSVETLVEMLGVPPADAPDLAVQVVDRVRAINFGAKEDVQALTIVYPIDFLPRA